MTPYEVLGVDDNASDDQVEEQYRRRAQETHPDRAGGNEEEFVAVQEAYEEIRMSRRQVAEGVRDRICALFQSLLQATDNEFTTRDIVSDLQRSVRQVQASLRGELAHKMKELERLERLSGRLVTDGQNMYQFVLDRERHALEMGLANLHYAQQLNDLVLDELGEYTDTQAEIPNRWLENC